MVTKGKAIEVHVFPNPSSKQVQLEFEGIVNLTKVSLINRMGRIVEVQQPCSNTLKFNTSQIQEDTCQVQIDTEDGSEQYQLDLSSPK